jgi:hypothetical protein
LVKLVAQILIIPGLDLQKVSYYSVKVNGRQISEFRDFQERMGINKRDKKQRNEINRHIERIGSIYGAKDEQFKREGWTERIAPPSHGFIDSDGINGVRLYCVRLNEELVILLNGDRKISHNRKFCPNCKAHFELANKLSDSIYEARQKGYIEINGRDIFIEEGFNLEIKN